MTNKKWEQKLTHYLFWNFVIFYNFDSWKSFPNSKMVYVWFLKNFTFKLSFWRIEVSLFSCIQRIETYFINPSVDAITLSTNWKNPEQKKILAKRNDTIQITQNYPYFLLVFIININQDQIDWNQFNE